MMSKPLSNPLNAEMNVRNWLATGLFVLTYPGFFVYHYAAGMHLIPLFAGGLASWVNILGTVVLAPFFLIDLIKDREWRAHVSVMALLAIVLLYSFYFKIEGVGYESSNDAFVYNVKMMFGLTNLYMIGYYFRDSVVNTFVLVGCFVVLTVLTLHGTYWSTLSFIMGEVKLSNGDITSSYQGFSTAYTVVCVVLLALIVNIRLLTFVVYIGTACVFVLVSRSELLGFLAVVSTIALMLLLRRQVLSAIFIELGAVLITAGMLFAPTLTQYFFAALQATANGVQLLIYKIQVGFDYLVSWTVDFINNVWDMIVDLFSSAAPEEQLSDADQSASPPPRARPEPVDLTSPSEVAVVEGNFRQQEILNLAQSQSLRERLLTFSSGWAGIKQSPIWGDYAGHIRDFDNPGMYMHNALSVWQQFGIVSFLVYIYVSARACLVSAVKVVLQKTDDDRAWRLVLFVSVYALTLVIASKSIYWPVPAFAWGLFAARIRSDRSNNAAAPTAHAAF